MQLIIFIGIPASGKSSFYKERFIDTHVRINRDMLKTKNRETKLFEWCLGLEQPCVIDNTNVTAKVRSSFIAKSREAGFKVIGYYFESKCEDCYTRNQQRPGAAKVPDVALYSKKSEMELPEYREGFDELHFVRISSNGFVVELWNESEK